jgi:hypothetical protein
MVNCSSTTTTSIFCIFFSIISSCCIIYHIIYSRNGPNNNCINGSNTNRRSNSIISFLVSETCRIPKSGSTTLAVEKKGSSTMAPSLCDTAGIKDTHTKQQSRWLSWNTGATNMTNTSRCNIDRLNHDELMERFGSMGVPALYSQPLVLKSTREWNEHFRSLTSYHNITKFFDDKFQVTLSSSNSFSSFRRTITLSQVPVFFFILMRQKLHQLILISFYTLPHLFFFFLYLSIVSVM